MLKEQFHDNKGLLISLTLLFLASLGSTLFLAYTLLSLHGFINKGERDFAAVLRLQGLFSDLQAAESSQRGYIITGDTNYLEPYNSASKEIPDDIKQLQSDHSLDAYRTQIDELIGLSQTRLQQLQHTIDIRKTTSLDATAATVKFSTGKQTMDTIRKHVTDIENAEFATVNAQERQSARYLRVSLILTPILVCFVLGMCVMIARLFHNAIRKERAIEGSKNEFLSLASHQLRTPATNVKQYIHLVLDGYFGKLDPAQREALEIANRNNDIEISVINDLLNIAKVDLNQIALRREPLSPKPLVKQVIADYKKVLSERKQTIKCTEKGPIGLVWIDPTYFRSVLENLVDNASKYTPTGGRLRIYLERGEDGFTLTVSDEGVGIAKADQAKLFNKFSRIPNPLSDTVEGSGLGLYWVRRVVELHGGTIGVQSKLGEGTSFKITLPVTEERPEAAQAELVSDR